MFSVTLSLEGQATSPLSRQHHQPGNAPTSGACTCSHVHNDNNAYLLALGHEEHLRGDLDLTLGNLRGHLLTNGE